MMNRETGSDGIITERLTIRRVVSSDWPYFKRLWEDQNRSVYACFDRTNDTSSGSVRERIEKWASYAESTEHMFFAVCLDSEMIGFFAFNRRSDGYETGYCFHSDHHGHGYALESLTALIGYISGRELSCHFSAGTALKNTPSVKLLTSAGFVMTGTELVSFYRDEDGNDIYFEGGIFELDVPPKR